MIGGMSGPGIELDVIELPSGLPPVQVLSREEAFSNPYTVAPEWTAEHEHAWLAMLDANTRLHDGPIWAVRSVTPHSLCVYADQYKRLAVQADERVGDLGVRILGIKGVLIGRDPTGAERLLIARRGSETRVYQGLWETAPAGGIDVRRALSEESILATLRAEMGEELGLTLPADVLPRIGAAVADPIAMSIDLIARVDWPLSIRPEAGLCSAGSNASGHAWEYIDAVWISQDEASAFAQQSPWALSPPTRAVLRWLGWIAPLAR